MQKTYCNQTAKGLGVFANAAIKSGITIGQYQGDYIPDIDDWRSMYLLQIAPFLYVSPIKQPDYHKIKDQLWFVNHSCEPNCAIIITDKIELKTIKPIKINEELTFDYSLTQTEPWSMNCLCGTKSCRQDIGSIHTIPLFTFIKYWFNRLIPKYAARRYWQYFK